MFKNHWINRRNKNEEKKIRFSISGNVPQEFKDALKNKSDDVVIFKVKFQEAENLNINKRNYSREVFQKSIDGFRKHKEKQKSLNALVEVQNLVNRKPLSEKEPDN